MKLSNRRGFTFAELLIAALIISVVLTGLMSTLRAGIAGYKRLDRSSGEIQELRLFTTLLDSELRNSIHYSEGPFTGGAKTFSFSTILEKPGSVMTDKSPVYLTYEYREKTLYRKEMDLTELFINKKERRKKIITSLNSFIVKYAYKEEEHADIKWMDQWEPEMGLPRGVQITLVIEGKRVKKRAKTEDYTVTRKFYIHQGQWGWLQKAPS